MASGNDKDLKIGITADTSGADAAKKSLEGVKEAAESAAAATSKATSGGKDPSVNPMTDGSQLAAGGASKYIEETTTARKAETQAIEEQAEALGELTDAEAGVIRSTGKLNEEAGKPDGFKALFDQQRLQGIGREFEKLGSVLGDLGRRYLATEEGQKMMAKGLDFLGEKTAVFGETAGKVTQGVATGFAQGGPIGAAIGGLSGLIDSVVGEYLDAQERIEASNRELAKAQAENAAYQEEKRKAAKSEEIEEGLEAEARLLERQNTALASQNELWTARKELAQSALDKERAQAELRGEDPSATERRQIDLDFRQEMTSLNAERNRINGEVDLALHARDVAARAAVKEGKNRGTASPEYAKLYDASQDAQAELERLWEDRPKQLEVIDTREATARNNRDAAMARLEDDRLNRELEARRKQQAEARRRGQDEARRASQQEREEERDEARVQGIGRSGESLADRAAGVAERKGNERAARAFEELGNKIMANPTGEGLKELVGAIERFTAGYEQKDAATARDLRRVQEELRRVQAQLKKGGDVPHK